MKHGSGAAVLAVAALGLAAAGQARAPGDAIGCQALAQAVHAAVLQSSAGGATVRPQQDPAGAGLLECADTARAVTVAFTRAMARGNIYLAWQWDRDRGDMCLSGDLSQCYPRGNPFVPLPGADAAFVADSWFAVVRAVGKSMPQGYFTDVTRFSGVALFRALTVELEAKTGGRLRQSYAVQSAPRGLPPATAARSQRSDGGRSTRPPASSALWSIVRRAAYSGR